MGLLNLINHNQYITENFIRKMRANTERAKRIGEEFRSLTDMITYSGGSAPMKGTAFSAVGNAEIEDTNGKDENTQRQENREGTEQTAAADTVGLDDVLLRAGAAEALEAGIEEEIAQIEIINRNNDRYINQYNNNIECGKDMLINYMKNYRIGDEKEIKAFITWIADRRPGLLAELYVVDSKSSGDVRYVYDQIFNEIVTAQKEENTGKYMEIYDKYRMNMAIGLLEEYMIAEDIDAAYWVRIEDILLRRNPRMLLNLYETQGAQGKQAAFHSLMEVYDRYKLDIMIDDVESLDMGGLMNQTQKETFVACWNQLVSMVPSNSEIQEAQEILIIAVMANIYLESGCSAPNANDGTYPGLDNSEDYQFAVDDEIAFGLLQWYFEGRKQALFDYAERTGGSVYDLETQLGYFRYEMEGEYNSAWSGFLKNADLDDATEYFCNNIERGERSSIPQRQTYAHMIENWYDNLNSRLP